MTCVIKSIDFGQDSIKPVIVTFENGALKSGQEDNLLCRYYKNKQNKLQIGAATNNMLYSGQVEPNDMYNTFIGICNKKKTKIRLVAVDCATLSPKFDDTGKLNKSIEQLESTNAQINKSFGSKRIKRKTEQRERMQMDIEHIKDQLEKTVADVEINPRDMVIKKNDDTDAEYKPNINRQAENLSEVYNIDDIVSFEVLNSVSEQVHKILEDKDSKHAATDFVSREIIKVLHSDRDDKMYSLQLLLYIDCLFKFMAKQAKELGVKSLNLCTYSTAVHDDILKRYTIMSRKSRLRPNSMRDKCLCSILILSMIVSKYQLNLESIGKELKISLKRVQDVSRVLAFEVNKGNAILKLPLPPPVNLSQPKRKKKQ